MYSRWIDSFSGSLRRIATFVFHICNILCYDRVFVKIKMPILFCFSPLFQFSSSVVSDSLRPHESQNARPPCPSLTPGVHGDSRPSSQWCHPAISSSVVPFSSCPNPSQHQSLSNESTLLMRWPKYWSFSFSIIPSQEIPGLITSL